MKPYDSYRKTDLPAAPRIPNHWGIKRLKHVVSMAYGDALAADVRIEGPVGVYGSNGQVGTHFVPNTDAPVIVVGRKGSYGKLNFSEEAVFCIDTAYYIGKSACEADLRFTFYAMQRLGLDTLSQDTGVPGLSREIAYRQPLALPPIQEQIAIASYLDVETARIDSLIEEKKRLLIALGELVSTRITEILTGKSEATIATGNIWLPRVPSGWTLKRLKYLGQVRSGLAKGKKNEAGSSTVELPYMRVANVQDGYIDLSDVALIEVAKTEVEKYSLQVGDVLMNEGGDYDKLGRGAMWEGLVDPCLHQNHVFAVRLDDVHWAPWVAAITRTSYAKFYFMNNSKQSTNLASINQTNVKEFPVVLPPVAKRDELLDALKNELARIDDLKRHVETELEKLVEFRSATVTDAVLGRIDVRNHMNP
jgi:type I restriction enzyme, S subunit